MLNILALFRHRRAPRRPRPNGSGRALIRPRRRADLSALEPCRPGSPTKPRPRQDAERGPPRGAQGYLAAHGLEKSYGGRRVVNGVSLYVRRGEAVGLLGPNGAGKTTAFYMITGLIKAERGKIELDGYDVTHLPMYQRARLGIGYLPQEASIFRGLNVEDNIRAVLEVVEPDRRRRDADLNALLEEFEITRHRKTPSIALSGGERRRVEIARALASRPNYMLLDEPFAGIDPKAVVEIQTAGAAADQSRHRRADHRPQCARDADLTDRSYIIYSGQVLMEGRKDDIVNDPEVRASISVRISGSRRSPRYSGSVPLLARLQNWYTPGQEPDKQESDQFMGAHGLLARSASGAPVSTHGAYPKTRNPAEPRARDDAAADAGHQAAAALQSGSGRLRRGRARAQSAAGADRGERGEADRRTPVAKRHPPRGLRP